MERRTHLNVTLVQAGELFNARSVDDLELRAKAGDVRVSAGGRRDGEGLLGTWLRFPSYSTVNSYSSEMIGCELATLLEKRKGGHTFDGGVVPLEEDVLAVPHHECGLADAAGCERGGGNAKELFQKRFAEESEGGRTRSIERRGMRGKDSPPRTTALYFCMLAAPMVLPMLDRRGRTTGWDEGADGAGEEGERGGAESVRLRMKLARKESLFLKSRTEREELERAAGRWMGARTAWETARGARPVRRSRRGRRETGKGEPKEY